MVRPANRARMCGKAHIFLSASDRGSWGDDFKTFLTNPQEPSTYAGEWFSS